MRSHRWRLKPWEKAIFFLAIINFGIFVAIDLWLGGDALNGHVTGGHYMLADHGAYTEVSHGVFVYSEIHASSLLLTHALAFLVVYRAKRRADRTTPK